MRKWLLMLAFGFVLVLITIAFATDSPIKIPTSAKTSKEAGLKPPSKETKVSFTGIVREISDTKIMIERTIKDKMETMEFELDKPSENIKTGDKVRISYIKKEGKNIVTKVTPTIIKKMIKKGAPFKEAKPAQDEPVLPQKK